MSRPPIKAFESIKKYCEKNKDCRGCPLFNGHGEKSDCEMFLPQRWRIKKEGDEK